MATGILAPNTKWYVNTQCGEPAVGGYFETSSAVTGMPQPTYADSGLTQPNDTRLRIGADGAVEADLYWAVGDDVDLYTIKTFDKFGNLIEEFTPYPITGGGGGGGDVTVVQNGVNYGRNEQFAFWGRGTSFNNDTLPVGTTETADDWYFTRSNTNATIVISKYDFSAGSSLVPFSPTSAFRYQVTGAAADSTQDLEQRYMSVQTLNNQQVTVLIYGATNNIGTTAEVSLYVKQYFGSGGSTTVQNIVETFEYNDTFNYYTATFTVPSISGKTIGSGGDDYLAIGYRFNPSQIQDILMVDYQFQSGQGTGINYPYVTEDEQWVKTIKDRLAGYDPSQGTNVIGWSATQTLNQFLKALQQGNVLIGWDFALNPNQLGQTINSVVNGTYIADQTILVSDGNGVVHKNSFVGMPLTLQVAIGSKKFGILQIIETSNSADLREKAVSLAAALTADSEITCKMAILKWTGTQDQQLRACVSAWNTPGTNPSLASGWSYIGTPQEFTAGTAEVYATLENVTLDSSSSFGVLIWNDSADLPVGEYLRFHKASLTLGETAFQPIPSDAGTVLTQCQRYLQRSYDWSQVLASGAITNAIAESSVPQSYWQSGGAGTTFGSFYPSTAFTGPLKISAQYSRVKFETSMFKAPSVTLYNSFTGAAGTGKAPLELSSGSISSGSEIIALTALDSNTTGFLVLNAYTEIDLSGAVIANTPQIFFHYIADAQLGV